VIQIGISLLNFGIYQDMRDIKSVDLCSIDISMVSALLCFLLYSFILKDCMISFTLQNNVITNNSIIRPAKHGNCPDFSETLRKMSHIFLVRSLVLFKWK
jgi:hypothetical protein